VSDPYAVPVTRHRRLVWVTLVAVCHLLPPPAAAAIPPIVREVSPRDGSTGVPTDTTLVVRGTGTWTEGSWLKLTLVEAATAKEVRVEQVSATWGKHFPPPNQPPHSVGGGSYTDTVFTYKPSVLLRPKTRYILRWENLHREPAESRFTTGSGPAGTPRSSPRPAPSP
jgi:hypothetical protein